MGKIIIKVGISIIPIKPHKPNNKIWINILLYGIILDRNYAQLKIFNLWIMRILLNLISKKNVNSKNIILFLF